MVVIQALEVAGSVVLVVLVAALGYVVLSDLLGPTGGEAADSSQPSSAPGTGTASTPATAASTESSAGQSTGAPGGPWWRRLAYATAAAWILLVAWPLPLAMFEVTTEANFETLSTVTAFGLLGLVFVIAVVRFVLLPAFLWTDVTVVRRHGGWEPSRLFYMGFGAISATLTCSYYLYCRHKRFGEPPFPPAVADLLAYRGPVASNWWFVVAAALVAGPVIAGVGAVAPLTELLPTAVAIPVEWLLFLALVGALLVRFVLLPVAFWKDANAVAAADVDWSPTAWVYVTLGYVFALPAGIYYLYRRHTLAPVSED